LHIAACRRHSRERAQLAHLPNRHKLPLEPKHRREKLAPLGAKKLVPSEVTASKLKP